MRFRTAAYVALLTLAATGAAQAQTAPLKLDPAQTPVAAAPLDMSRLRSSFDLTPDQAEALRAGIARTSVDHRFVDKLTGSVGFLCGLHGGDYDEASAMRGADPAGKFLGAKLSLAFR
jgi:hypothetical protein